MSDFDPTNGTPWTDTPGLYAALNIDGQTALDEDTNGNPQGIHGWLETLTISDDTSSGTEDGGPVVPQTGDADKNTAHWRIVLAEAGDLYKVYVKSNGNCLTLHNGNSGNGTKIRRRFCDTTQNKVKKGQVWCIKKQN
ncbi:hypothetical protein DL764_007522 [Monosporascus ibericus]|uniref:Ricin B lectin domain-containing protein n=1 Tax=Monosporascus ibericus TaxID=155417 RepID=A0A4Q4T2C9_9PEZI|nr:hypothetical protein DL764_007522 [Monosporascus ibericus]